MIIEAEFIENELIESQDTQSLNVDNSQTESQMEFETENSIAEEITEVRLDTSESKIKVGAVSDRQLLADLAKIPNRMAFKIGDVAEIVAVKAYVLRYWESEFKILKPKKANNNQRMYSRKDVETVMLIKKLLYRDKFSIGGARAAIKKLRADVKDNVDVKESIQINNQAINRARGLLESIRSSYIR